MWTKVSNGEARQHPLFGVKGSLLLVGCSMFLLAILSPLNQIISKEMSGYVHPHFVPSLSFILLIVAVWGVFRRRAYVRAYVYSLAGLTVVGLLFILYFGDVPYLPYRVNDAILTLLIKDIPLCSYFTWSRRARVTLECRVRSDDPLLSQKDIATIHNGGRSADSAKSSVGTAVKHNSFKPRPAPDPNSQRASSYQDLHQDDVEPKRRIELLLQYSSSVRDAYEAISDLPEEWKRRFRATVLEPGGHNEAKAVATRLLDEHHKRMRPFDSTEANDFLEKARNLGPAAEKEFVEVMELLGSSASPAAIFEKLYTKYGVNGPWGRRAHVNLP